MTRMKDTVAHRGRLQSTAPPISTQLTRLAGA